MRNRAKCKLCGDVIESYHATDYVICKCDQIAVFEGDSMRCAAKEWKNFVRVDDEGNEIIPMIKRNNAIPEIEPSKYNIEDNLDAKQAIQPLLDMIESYERLPEHAMQLQVTNYDMLSVLKMLLSLLSD